MKLWERVDCLIWMGMFVAIMAYAIAGLPPVYG